MRYVLTIVELLKRLMTDQTQCLRQADLVERLGVSISTIQRWIADGKFPAPMKINRVLLWREAAVEQWMEDQEKAP